MTTLDTAGPRPDGRGPVPSRTLTACAPLLAACLAADLPHLAPEQIAGALSCGAGRTSHPDLAGLLSAMADHLTQGESP